MFRFLFRLMAMRFGLRLLTRFFGPKGAQGAAGHAARTRRY
jgi:hypothetical protein